MDADGANQNQKVAQLATTSEEAHAAQIEGRLKDLHTCLPGIIHKFDPITQTAEVQPAIKRIFTEKGPVNLPLCVDVPVAFPGGGDFFLTFPVKAGDECILHFSERAIDFWHFNGGVQLPAEYRLHDLSDAFAVVGINSQPKKIPSFNATDTQLRNRDGSAFFSIAPDNTLTALNPQGSWILSSDGTLTIGVKRVNVIAETDVEFEANKIGLLAHHGVYLDTPRVFGRCLTEPTTCIAEGERP